MIVVDNVKWHIFNNVIVTSEHSPTLRKRLKDVKSLLGTYSLKQNNKSMWPFRCLNTSIERTQEYAKMIVHQLTLYMMAAYFKNKRL